MSVSAREHTLIERHANGLPSPWWARPLRWWARRKTGFWWGALVAAVAFFLLAVGVAWATKPYAPLYGYGGSGTHTFMITNLPTETINTSTSGSVAISVLTVKDGSTEQIDVKGQKCSSANHVIETSVDKAWISVQPPGWIVDAPVPKLVSRPPGCLVATIHSQVPAGVVARLRILAQHHIRTSLWKIQGSETPTNPSGESARWQSLTFAIVYQGPA